MEKYFNISEKTYNTFFILSSIFLMSVTEESLVFFLKIIYGHGNCFDGVGEGFHLGLNTPS